MYSVGIDPSSRKVGVVVLSPVPLVFKEDAPKKLKHRAHVCAHFFDWSVHLFCRLRDEFGSGGVAAWIEEPIINKKAGPKVSMLQGQVEGVLMAAAHQSGVTSVYSVHHTEWKKEVVGHGNPGKPAIGSWLEQHQPELASLAGGDQDLIDAACIALYGAGVLARADRFSG